MNNIYEDINDIIEEVTTTGKTELDGDYMKSLKNYCKSSEDNLKIAYNILMVQLEKDHAEVRYSAFQIINELFIRSHLFRQLVLRNLHNVFLFTIETDPINNPFPLPSQAGKSLKVLALKMFNDWHYTYGKYYRKLSLGYEFLETVKGIKFSNVVAVTLEQRQKEKMKKLKEELLRKSKLEQVDMQFDDQYNDIIANIKQIENCFELVYPKMKLINSTAGKEAEEENKLANNLSDSNIESESDKINSKNLLSDHGHHSIGTDTDSNIESESAKINSKNLPSDDGHHSIGTDTGICARNYAINIEIPSKHAITETGDNAAVIKNMQELYKELNRQLPTVKRWLHILMKYASADEEKIKKILDLKNTLSAVNLKYLELDIVTKTDESESDEEFLDVPEKLLENKFLNKKEESSTSTPCIAQCTDKPGPSGLTRKEKLLKVAPVLPFDVDLAYWENEKIEVPSSVKLESLHRFWKPSEHEESFVPPQIESALRSRRMTFSGKYEPVKRKCGAPLLNGTFCDRMDRFKCPFHGKIVERDEIGRPLDLKEAEKESKRKHERERLERESIQKEIDLALGTNLSSKKRKKNNSKRDKSRARYARLTNIKTDNTKSSSTKLEKKLFSARALDKVYASMNLVIQRKHDEKFGSNFNYRS